MGLILTDKDHHILGRRYNVEYKLGNDSVHTLSNTLENVDNKYFWFMSEADGLDIIAQDSIVTMVCLDRE